MDCSCKKNYISVFKSMPTRFDGVDWMQVNFEDSVIDLTGFEADFIIGSTKYHYTNIKDGFIVNLTAEETGKLPLGLINASLIVYDTEGATKPFTTSIPVMVRNFIKSETKVETYDVKVNALLDNTVQFAVHIETAKINQDWVKDLIQEHNESAESHQDIREDITNVHDELLEDIDELAEIVETKQDKLIAGDGIDITDNVITNTRKKAMWSLIEGDIKEQQDLQEQFSTKQDSLISGVNIKTINDQSILGEGNIKIEGGSGGEFDCGNATSVYILPDQSLDCGDSGYIEEIEEDTEGEE